MPKPLRMAVTVREGRPSLTTLQRRRITDWCRAYQGEEEQREAVMILEHPARTTSQNAYLHAIFNRLTQSFRDAGLACTVEGVKTYFKRKHLPEEYEPMPGGAGISYVPSTTKLSTREMSEFIEAIRQDEEVREYHGYVPTPDEWKMGMRHGVSE